MHNNKNVSHRLSIFAECEHEILCELVQAGTEHARQKNKNHGRPATVKKTKSKLKRYLILD